MNISEDTRIRAMEEQAKRTRLEQLEADIKAGRRFSIFKACCDKHWQRVTELYIYLPIDLQLIYMGERLNHAKH